MAGQTLQLVMPSLHPDDLGLSGSDLVNNLFTRSAIDLTRGVVAAHDYAATLTSLDTALVDGVAEELLVRHVDRLWDRGWLPSELVRQARRDAPTPAAERLVLQSMAADHSERRAATLDSRWRAQLDTLELPHVSGRAGWLPTPNDLLGTERSTFIGSITEALATMMRLPALEQILPPPGSPGVQSRPRSTPLPDGGATIDPVLERIRALLAKAESSEYEAEATVFTAKAQELMTRHAIDAAVLAEKTGMYGPEAGAIRLPIDPPYYDAKSLLLQLIADNSRCRAVRNTTVGLSTVVGIPDDLAAVELMFTSLLVQAQTAMGEAARTAAPGTKTRSQSFRNAFLLSYAHRIGARLEEINKSVLAAAAEEHGSAFLPVLSSQSAAVEDWVNEQFPEIASARPRTSHDPAGWASGREAANRARLNSGDLES